MDWGIELWYEQIFPEHVYQVIKIVKLKYNTSELRLNVQNSKKQL